MRFVERVLSANMRDMFGSLPDLVASLAGDFFAFSLFIIFPRFPFFPFSLTPFNNISSERTRSLTTLFISASAHSNTCVQDVLFIGRASLHYRRSFTNSITSVQGNSLIFLGGRNGS